MESDVDLRTIRTDAKQNAETRCKRKIALDSPVQEIVCSDFLMRII
jgi:hypothetical protein